MVQCMYCSRIKLHWCFEMNEGGSGSTGMVACKDLG